MTNPATMEREELIALVACGELDAEHPAVAKRLASDTSLAREIAELRAIALAVEDTGALRQTGPEDSSSPDHEALVLDGFRTLAGVGSSQSAPTVASEPAPSEFELRLSIGLRAAAVVAFLLIGAQALRSSLVTFDPRLVESVFEPGTHYLGDGTISVPEELPFGTLRWRLEDDSLFLPTVNVRVYALLPTGARGDLLASFKELEVPFVQLGSAVLEGHERLLYEVEIRDEGAALPLLETVRQER